MRRELQVDVEEFIGSNYQIGVEQGDQIAINDHFYLLKAISKNTNSKEVKVILQDISPGFLDELRGIADGLKIDFNTVLRMYSGYNLPVPPMGCTSFSHDNYYIRNYDFTPEIYDARFVFHKSEEGYASVGFSDQILGRLDGMNEHGLIVGLHLVNEHYTGTGFIATTIVRLVLEQCRNVEEAVNLIMKLPHGYCYNYSLVDKQGRKCIVEASPEKQIVHESPILMCTNHFETDLLKVKNRTTIAGSIHRKEFLQSLSSNDYPLEVAFKKFNNENSPLFYKEYRQFFGTLHTVIYLPNTLEVIVGIGGNANPITFSLDKWLNGDIKVKGTIIGEIDY